MGPRILHFLMPKLHDADKIPYAVTLVWQLKNIKPKENVDLLEASQKLAGSHVGAIKRVQALGSAVQSYPAEDFTAPGAEEQLPAKLLAKLTKSGMDAIPALLKFAEGEDKVDLASKALHEIMDEEDSLAAIHGSHEGQDWTFDGALGRIERMYGAPNLEESSEE